MQTKPCAHFSTEVELISLQHTPVVLRVPVRRCALAERMIAILSRTTEGREVASKIQLMETSSHEGAGPQTGYLAAFGPDLEAINRVECIAPRCRASCTPGYRQILQHFGFMTEAEQETGEGCLELDHEPVDA